MSKTKGGGSTRNGRDSTPSASASRCSTAPSCGRRDHRAPAGHPFPSRGERGPRRRRHAVRHSRRQGEVRRPQGAQAGRRAPRRQLRLSSRRPHRRGEVDTVTTAVCSAATVSRVDGVRAGADGCGDIDDQRPPLTATGGRGCSAAAGWAPCAHLPVLALVVAYAVRFSLLTVNVHDGYGTPAFDMAIPDQAIWLMSRFHAPFITVMGRNFFGDHTSFVLLLLVPLYWVYPHTAALLVVQSVLLAAAAIPIYVYARHRLNNTVLATLLAASYPAQPGPAKRQPGAVPRRMLHRPAPRLRPVRRFGGQGLDARDLRRPAPAVQGGRRPGRRPARRVDGLAAATGRGGLCDPQLLALAWTLFASEVVINSLVGVANVHNGRIPFGGVRRRPCAPSSAGPAPSPTT